MSQRITYDDKVSLTTSSLPRANKCTAEDLNQIKSVVNQNATDNDNQHTTIENSINTINEKIKSKLIITANMIRQNINIPTDWAVVKIPLNNSVQIGNKFTISNNSIKIGSGIKKVLVSAHCNAIGFSIVGGDKEFTIYKNDSVVADAYNAEGNNWKSADISPLLLEVSQNDLISLKLISGQAGSVEILGGYLTIEVVEEG